MNSTCKIGMRESCNSITELCKALTAHKVHLCTIINAINTQMKYSTCFRAILSHGWAIAFLLILLSVFVPCFNSIAQCNLTNLGAATAPAGCTTYTLSGPAGAYWQTTFTNGVSYTFTYAANGNAQAGGMCINGVVQSTPYTSSALSGTVNIGIKKANTTWSSTSATLTYRTTAPTTATAGGAQTTDCGLTSTSLGGNTPTIGTGTWTETSGGGTSTYSSVNSGSSTATATTYGNYTYTWTINNGGCTSAATTGTITYNQSPTITTSPSTTAYTACIRGSFGSISVAAAGAGLSYQWYSNTSNSNSSGTSLGSANGAQTAIYTPQASVAGTLYYFCKVSGTCSPAATSNVSGSYTVAAQPIIYINPTSSQTVCQTSSVTLTAAATSSISGGTFSYQWYYNATTNNNTTGSAISGASGTGLASNASATYNLITNNASTTSPGGTSVAGGPYYYYCVFTPSGTGCNPVTTNTAAVTIYAAPTSASITEAINPCSGGYVTAVDITGGTSPYTFDLSCSGWYTGPVPIQIDASGAATCTLGSVTDAHGCPCNSVTGNPVTFGTRSLTTGGTEPCPIPAHTTQNFFDATARLMATVTSGATALGSTSITVAVDTSVQKTPTSPSAGYPDYSTNAQSYLQRHFVITPTTSAAANICLYISDSEVNNLVTASASDNHGAPAFYQTFAANLSNANITKYNGGAGSGTQQTPGNHASPPVVITSIIATHNPTVDGTQYINTWSLCFNVGSFSGFYINASNVHNDPLPVTLITFTATAIDNKYIELDWATASETDNSGFQIERGTDGIVYDAVGWAAGHGTSSTINNYQYEDLTALPGMLYYYRLKQIDVDGNFVYSNIASASLTGSSSFNLENLFPNPASNEVSIGVISNINTTAVIIITDMLGRTILKEDWPLAIGYNTNQFGISTVPAGEYEVTIYTDSGRSSKRLVILRR